MSLGHYSTVELEVFTVTMQAKILALVLLAAAVAEAANCPSVTATSFDIKTLTPGDWFLRQETPQSWFFPNKCTKNTYGTADESGAVPVSQQWRFKWFPFSLFNMNTKYEDTTINSSQGNFTEKKQSLFHPTTTYQYLGGDLKTYAVFYSCKSHFLGKTERVQILSSSTDALSQDVMNNVASALKNVNISSSSLAEHDQSCWTSK